MDILAILCMSVCVNIWACGLSVVCVVGEERETETERGSLSIVLRNTKLG